MAMTPIENELVESAGFKPGRKYQRQDYLAALARAVNEIEEVDFDTLSIEAQDWFNEAVRALNKKADLPEFPDGNGKVEDEPAAKVASNGNPRRKPAPAEVIEDEPEDEEEAEEPSQEDEPEEDEPAEDDAEIDEPEQKLHPKATMGPRRKGQAPRKLPHPELKFTQPIAPEDVVLEDDKWGLVVGTKKAAAVHMFEQGCRMADVTASIGGTYYNMLQDLTKAGHTVEKGSNGIIKVIHRDNIPAKAAPKAKKKKV